MESMHEFFFSDPKMLSTKIKIKYEMGTNVRMIFYLKQQVKIKLNYFIFHSIFGVKANPKDSLITLTSLLVSQHPL